MATGPNRQGLPAHRTSPVCESQAAVTAELHVDIDPIIASVLANYRVVILHRKFMIRGCAS